MLWVVDPSLSKRVKVNGKLMKATNPLYLDHPSLFTAQTGAETINKWLDSNVNKQIEVNSISIPSDTNPSTKRI